MATVNYVGPYTQDVYNAANMLSSGNGSGILSPRLVSAGQEVLNKQNDVLGISTTTPVQASSGSGSGSGQSYDRNDLAFVDSQASLVDKLIASLGDKTTQGFGNIDRGYQSNVNKAQEQRDRAINQYNTQRTDTLEQKDSALGKVDTYARTLADSVRQRLGLSSGNNSSAYLYAAPNAIARDASGKRTDVMENYGTNLRNLDTAENYAKNDFESLLQDYINQREDQKRQFESGIYEQNQNLQLQRGQLAGERARLTGAGYNGIRTAQQPYLNAYSDLDTKLNSLFQKYQNPVYQTRDVATKTPTLSDYVVDQTAINANRQTGDNSPYAPYSNFLKKEEEKQLGY